MTLKAFSTHPNKTTIAHLNNSNIVTLNVFMLAYLHTYVEVLDIGP